MLAESYAYYFSKNTPMKIKYFKAQIVFLLWAVASAAYKKSECEDSEACRSGSMSLNGHVEAVATLLLEAKLGRCADAIDRKCSDIGAIKGKLPLEWGRILPCRV